MAEKQIKDYDYSELHDYLTGKAIVALGEGKKFKSIIYDVMYMTSLWNVDKEKKENEKKK